MFQLFAYLKLADLSGQYTYLTQMVDTKPEMGYWKIRGFAHMVRETFHAAGQDYSDVQYTMENAPEWFGKHKPALNADMPNLPYVKFADGSVVTEHDTCMRAVALNFKKELLGADKGEMGKVDQFLTALVKMTHKVRPVCYKKDPEATKEEVEKAIADHDTLLAACNKRVGENNWVASANLSVADIYLNEMIHVVRMMHEAALEKYPNLVKFQERYESQDHVKAYKARADYVAGPINGPMAAINAFMPAQ
jgi:glutathione S-transferase